MIYASVEATNLSPSVISTRTILLEPQLLKKCPWLMCSAGLNNCAVCSFNPSYLLTADSLHLLKILSEKWSSCECLQYEGDNRKTIHNRNNPLLLVSE